MMVNRVDGFRIPEVRLEEVMMVDPVTAFVIPLILCGGAEVFEGGCRRLRFVQLDQVSREETSIRFAKLIIEGSSHILKVDHLEDLEFDEIDYEFTREGTSFRGTQRRGDATIEEMSNEELEEIQELFNKTLLQEETEDDSKSIDEERDSGLLSRINPNINLSSQILQTIEQLAQASLNSRRASEERAAERRLDEIAVQARDIRQRAEKKREQRWQMRQQVYLARDEARVIILASHRRKELLASA